MKLKIPEPFNNKEEYEEHLKEQARKEMSSKGGKNSQASQKKKYGDKYGDEMRRRGSLRKKKK